MVGCGDDPLSKEVPRNRRLYILIQKDIKINININIKEASQADNVAALDWPICYFGYRYCGTINVFASSK